MTELITRGGIGKNRWLVFTSAGDRSGVHRWLKGRRGFDLWITYYGEVPGTHEAVADIYNIRKGSKFQNLYYAYNHWREIIDRYAAVMVIDDDIMVSGENIAKLFELLDQNQLWALQPAFSPWGKISWPITKVQRWKKVRYTNFIEMSCPVFRADKLADFMSVYDPALAGWGCDWWFLHVLGPDLRGRVAIIDEVVCINPLDIWKGGEREIDRMQTSVERKKTWERIKQERRIQSDGTVPLEFSAITKTWGLRLLGRGITLAESMLLTPVRSTRRILRRLGSGGGRPVTGKQ